MRAISSYKFIINTPDSLSPGNKSLVKIEDETGCAREAAGLLRERKSLSPMPGKQIAKRPASSLFVVLTVLYILPKDLY
jgi:hypothetical protein